ncbi:MAG TPA: prepilin peptidase [Acidimicrobiia bacterium]|jgi:leader peptidase (prepilin peptidase)/N-methyltransferase
MTGFVVFVCAVLGLMVGSFLNVVIWRVPRKESVVTPASHCPGCDAPIAPYDNVPVASWVILRARCRGCGDRISARYPMVELANAGLWAAVALRFGAVWELPAYLVFVSALLALALIDLDTFLLPDRIVYPLSGALVALFGLAAVMEGDLGSWVRAVLAGLASFGVFLVIHLISPRGMGFGDVKLSFSLGVALGWLSWGTVFVGFFLGFLIGSVVGLGLLAAGVTNRKQHVPFGPYLAAGAVLALFVAQPVVSLYLGH